MSMSIISGRRHRKLTGQLRSSQDTAEPSAFDLCKTSRPDSDEEARRDMMRDLWRPLDVSLVQNYVLACIDCLRKELSLSLRSGAVPVRVRGVPSPSAESATGTQTLNTFSQLSTSTPWETRFPGRTAGTLTPATKS